MARARNIKPGFFKNEDLAECSLASRLCFAGLWTLADREGRLEDRPKRIKGELFAFDSIEVEPLLVELQRYGFIQRYVVESRGFIQIIAFHKHQNPHHKEPPSAIPPPESPGFYPHATNQESETAPALHDGETLDKTEASPSFSGDERAKHGGKTVLNPDSGFLNPDSTLRDPPEPNRATKAGAVCVVMKSEGMGQVNPSHPLLVQLLSQGAEIGEFADAARIAVEGKKGFSYALAIVKSRMEQTAELASDAMSKSRAKSGGSDWTGSAL